MPTGTIPKRLMEDISGKCNALIIDHRMNGPEAVKQDLRVQLEVIADKASRILEDRGYVRYNTVRTEIDLPKRDLKHLIREGAEDIRQYVGTFANLFHPSGMDDTVMESSYVLARRCMEVLYFHLLCRDAVAESGDETVYRSWLGILITS